MKLVIDFIIYRIVSLVVPFLTIGIFATSINKNDLGVFFLCQSISTWLSIFIDFGMVRHAVNLTSKDENFQGIGILYGQFILTIFLVPIFIILPFLFKSLTAYDCFFILSYAFTLSAVPKWYFQAKQKMKVISIIEIIIRSSVCVIIYVFIDDYSSRYFIELLYSLSGIIIIVTSYIYIFKRLDRFSFRISIKNIIREFRDSKYIFVSRFIGALSLNSNTILLGIYSTPESIAIYGMSERLIKAMSSVLNSVSEAIYPIYKKNNIDVNKVIIIAFLFSLLSCIFVYVFSGFILSYGFHIKDHKYMDIMVWSCIFISLSSVYSLFYFISLGKYKLELYSQITIGILSLILCYSLIVNYNVLGAAIAYLLVSMLSLLIILLYKKKFHL